MKIETQELGNRQVELHVHVPDERVQKALRLAARQVSKRMRIPGFRPGKAPFEIVAHNVGEEYLLEEALESLGQDIYREALEQTDLEPFAPGSLEEIVSREPLVIRYSVPLAPEADLGDYRGVRLEYQEPEVDDESLEEVLEELRQGQALIEPVDRPAQTGDVVVIDVVGRLDGPEAGSGLLIDDSNVSLLLDEETDWPFPGIAASLVGTSAGQEESVEYHFPDDYSNESLRGQTAKFDFTVHEVKSRTVPEWSDDLARNLGDFDDLLALRIKLRQNLTEEATRRADSDFADQVIQEVVEQSQVSYPPLLLEQEIDDMLTDLRRQLQGQNLALEDYLKIEDKSDKDLREDLRPRAEERLKRALVLGQVVEEENLSISPEEIDEEIDNLLSGLGEQAQQVRSQFDNPRTRRSIELDLLTSKAVRRLVDIAKGAFPGEPTGPGEEVGSGGPVEPETTPEPEQGLQLDPAEDEVEDVAQE